MRDEINLLIYFFGNKKLTARRTIEEVLYVMYAFLILGYFYKSLKISLYDKESTCSRLICLTFSVQDY